MMDMDGFPLISWLHPEQERDEARHIVSHLTLLASHENYFRSAGELIDHAAEYAAGFNPENREQGDKHYRIRMWAMIAAHHAAFSIYHFRSSLASIRDRLSQCPELAKKVDRKAIEEAFNQIDKDFPYWREIRDAIGHFSDKIFKPADVDTHKPDDAAFVHGNLSGYVLTFTRDKKYITLNLSPESLAKLGLIKRRVWGAFRKAVAQQPQG